MLSLCEEPSVLSKVSPVLIKMSRLLGILRNERLESNIKMMSECRQRSNIRWRQVRIMVLIE